MYKKYFMLYPSEETVDGWVCYATVMHAETREIVNKFEVAGKTRTEAEDTAKLKMKEIIDSLMN